MDALEGREGGGLLPAAAGLLGNGTEGASRGGGRAPARPPVKKGWGNWSLKYRAHAKKKEREAFPPSLFANERERFFFKRKYFRDTPEKKKKKKKNPVI